MKYINFIQVALTVGFSLLLLAAIIYSVLNTIGDDLFFLTLIIDAVILVPLFVLIYYGLRAFRNPNDKRAQEAIFVVSTILVTVPTLVIYRFILKPEMTFMLLFLISIILLLLWILNSIAFWFPKNKREIPK